MAGATPSLARPACRSMTAVDWLMRRSPSRASANEHKVWTLRCESGADGERQLFENQCITEKLYPPDIARMVLWLAADDSRMCTAQNFIVDAGWT